MERHGKRLDSSDVCILSRLLHIKARSPRQGLFSIARSYTACGKCMHTPQLVSLNVSQVGNLAPRVQMPYTIS